LYIYYQVCITNFKPESYDTYLIQFPNTFLIDYSQMFINNTSQSNYTNADQLPKNWTITSDYKPEIMIISVIVLELEPLLSYVYPFYYIANYSLYNYTFKKIQLDSELTAWQTFSS